MQLCLTARVESHSSDSPVPSNGTWHVVSSSNTEDRPSLGPGLRGWPAAAHREVWGQRQRSRGRETKQGTWRHIWHLSRRKFQKSQEVERQKLESENRDAMTRQKGGWCPETQKFSGTEKLDESLVNRGRKRSETESLTLRAGATQDFRWKKARGRLSSIWFLK